MSVRTKNLILAALILAAGRAALAEQPGHPLPEHPRPDWERADWVNLNGDWKFAFDKRDAGLGERWYAEPDERFGRRIRVPFGWGSPLSGVGDEADVGWYRRGVAVPESWKGRRVFVVFGAADHDATVWFAGRRVGEHLGGYTPFEAEVTDLIDWGRTQPLTVRVWDEPAETAKNGWRLFGKQGYGNVRGLWQTVYLEARPETYLERVRFTSDLAASSVSAAVTLGAPAKRSLVCRVRLADGSAQAEAPFAPGETEKTLSLKLAKPRLWSPDDPHLYDATVRLEPAEPSAAERAARQRVAAECARLDGKARAAYSRYVSLEDPDVRHGFDETAVDEVRTYFGFREVGTAHVAAAGGAYVTLNGQPVYLRMALDQGYHPEGWYVFPTDAALRDDVALAKSLGLNGLRFHIKAEIPRKLYWADRLGLLVMADVPCAWGAPEERGWAEHRSCYEEMVARDFNHPSIFSWVLFNETWGLLSDEADQPPNRQGRRQRLLPSTQRRVAAEWRRAKDLDPTRLIEDNSPCNQDHVLGDLNTWHGYLANWHWESNVRDTCDRDLFAGSGRNHIDGFVQTGAPLVNSECGAVWGYKGSTGDIDWSWDYHAMMDAFRRHLKNSGFVFTEIADVTNEWNGYVRFDRSPKETGLDELMPGMSLRDFHADAYLAVGEAPCATFGPGGTLRAPVALSCVTDELKGRPLSLRARLRWWDARGELHEEPPVVGETFAGGGFGVWPLDAPALRLPDEAACGTACFELLDGDRTAARNFTCFVVREKTPKGLRADACTAEAWTQGRWSVLDGLKVCGAGRGAFEYAFDVPADAAGDWEFFAEVSTKRLNGKDRAKGDGTADDLAFMLGGGIFDRSRNPNAYPMTSADKWPGGVLVSVGGETLADVALPDDPADHRGILSWQAQLRDQRLREAGSYGYPVRVRIPARFVKAAAGGKLAVRLAAKGEHGLAVYGESFGRFPSGPALRPVPADPAYATIDNFGPYASSDPLRGHFGVFELGANLSSVTIRDSDITLHADRWPRTHLATVGPKSAPYVTKRGNRMEIFDPYVSCTVGTVRVENVRLRGEVPDELVHAVEFKDVNGDGDSSGAGRVGDITFRPECR